MSKRALRHIVLAAATAVAAAAGAVPLPTEPFRREHREIQAQLREVQGKLGKVESASGPERARLMHEVVTFFQEDIHPHAAWEERILYPEVDTRAGSRRTHPFTASMRHEHKIVGRWIGELEDMRRAKQPDARAFVRRADNLLGLVWAHFEAEEEVLLPILDATMKPAEFERLMHATLHQQR